MSIPWIILQEKCTDRTFPFPFSMKLIIYIKIGIISIVLYLVVSPLLVIFLINNCILLLEKNKNQSIVL